jgi:uncharacterized protein YjlB
LKIEAILGIEQLPSKRNINIHGSIGQSAGSTEVLGIAKEVFQVLPGGPGELIEKGSGDVILLRNLGHLAVDALIDPNVFDNFDTGLRI